MATDMDCQECGQRVDGAEFHPYLFCLLYKCGVRHQDAYLRESGYVREAARAEDMRRLGLAALAFLSWRDSGEFPELLAAEIDSDALAASIDNVAAA